METHSRREKFEKIIERLTEFIVLGKAHVEIGKGIANTITGDPVISGVAPVFWGMSITAHIDAAQMFAFKLFDTRSGSMTVQYLLERAQECSTDFQRATPEQVSALIRDACTDIRGIADSLKPLRAKRNRILAHVDSTIVGDPGRLAKETKVTFGDLDRIFGAGGKIVNTISGAFRDISSSLVLTGTTDYESVVQLIVDAKHAQVDRYEKEFNQPSPFPRPKLKKSAW
ncbi:MAG: hypothetical protein WBD87_07625 [Candidatus Acidiferrales bacterium]